jgi:hypothetical protein
MTRFARGALLCSLARPGRTGARPYRRSPLAPWRQRIGPVLALFFFAPISAEYLLGYDSLIGRPAELLVGLLIFGPLYGAPAVLIREAARRTGRGWPTILLLSFAAGLVQAGLIDQSLFNPSYRDIPYWDAMRLPTYLPGLGFSAYMVLSFLGGHMMQSYAAPIAVIEALHPRLVRQPWLGRPGLVVVTLLYLAAAGLVLVDQSQTEDFVASAGQLIGSAVVVITLVVVAFRLPRTRRMRPGTPPRPTAVGVVAFLAIACRDVLPTNWMGVAFAGLALIGLGVLVWRWSGRTGWGGRHVLALAAAVLAVNVAMAFVIQPLGSPDPAIKYAVNSVLALGVAALLLAAARRVRHQPTANPPSNQPSGSTREFRPS